MNFDMRAGWPSLDERVIRHAAHLMDTDLAQDLPNGFSGYVILDVEGTRFPAITGRSMQTGFDITTSLVVLPPYEGTVNFSLDDLAALLLRMFPAVSFVHFPISDDFVSSSSYLDSAEVYTRLYQHGTFDPEHYARIRRKKGKRRGYTIRDLGLADFKAVEEVHSSWMVNRLQRYLFDREDIASGKVPDDPLFLHNLMGKAGLEKQSMYLVDQELDEGEYGNELLVRGHRYVGLFSGDQLLAYASLHGHREFVHLRRGAQVVRPGEYPLLCLDLALFEQFARDKVAVVDWGHNPDVVPGKKDTLLAYKQRFSPTPLVPVQEWLIHYKR